MCVYVYIYAWKYKIKTEAGIPCIHVPYRTNPECICTCKWKERKMTKTETKMTKIGKNLFVIGINSV